MNAQLRSQKKLAFDYPGRASSSYDSAAKLQHKCESLIENQSLSFFPVRLTAMTQNGMLALDELLQLNVTLQSLMIDCTVSELTNNEKDGLVFEQALRHCHLQVFEVSTEFSTHDDLVACAMACGGFISNVCHGLAQNTTIRWLKLARIHITDNDALALGNALKANNRLRSLKLSCVSISDIGWKNICYGLQHNCTITKFSMDGTPVSSKGILTISDMLKKNTRINMLRIIFLDDVGKEAKEPLVRTIIEDNFTLKSIYLGPLEFGEQRSDYKQSLDDIFDAIRYLNMDGRRRKIMKQSNDVPIGLWAHILASSPCTKSTDVLFHFIKSKPELFKS